MSDTGDNAQATVERSKHHIQLHGSSRTTVRHNPHIHTQVTAVALNLQALSNLTRVRSRDG